ncbi:MAG: hypothetical protein C7B47_15045 [Sulfobacillus thermosulfidooxidans]|uniref:Uncharacterized protein n=1 Tax=Sulfobacillus thermosulfidooxidans TaxID=28034 RepID=A0A2T2WQ02_SULTH|nr:MAG: hypothetical protein C7B47_15045 [Sulfobacillus thermosulfidooxidans]
MPIFAAIDVGLSPNIGYAFAISADKNLETDNKWTSFSNKQLKQSSNIKKIFYPNPEYEKQYIENENNKKSKETKKLEIRNQLFTAFVQKLVELPRLTKGPIILAWEAPLWQPTNFAQQDKNHRIRFPEEQNYRFYVNSGSAATSAFNSIARMFLQEFLQEFLQKSQENKENETPSIITLSNMSDNLTSDNLTNVALAICEGFIVSLKKDETESHKVSDDLFKSDNTQSFSITNPHDRDAVAIVWALAALWNQSKNNQPLKYINHWKPYQFYPVRNTKNTQPNSLPVISHWVHVQRDVNEQDVNGETPQHTPCCVIGWKPRFLQKTIKRKRGTTPCLRTLSKNLIKTRATTP